MGSNNIPPNNENESNGNTNAPTFILQITDNDNNSNENKGPVVLVEKNEHSVDGKAVMRKVTWRIIPYLCFLYILCYIDRVNIGNVHDVLLKDLSLTEVQFGQIVGIFFLGYCIFEIPSNMIMKKISPSKWISRIFCTWGFLTLSIAFCKNFASLMIVRVLVGLSEAGFFPGILFYFTFWFSDKERALKISLFYTGNGLAGSLGGLLAYFILSMNGLGGLFGWQWLFILEGGTSVLIGITILFLLPDYPSTSSWLTPEEKKFVMEQAAFVQTQESKKIVWGDILKTFLNVKILIFGLIFFFELTNKYILSFFLPSIISEFGFSTLIANLLTAPIYFVAVLFSIANSLASDRSGKYGLHVVLASIVGTISFACLAIGMKISNLSMQFIFATGATISSASLAPPLLAWASNELQSTTSKAAGIALVVSLGNIGGYVGPQIMSFSIDHYKSYANGIGIASSFYFIITIIVIVIEFLKFRSLRYNEIRDKAGGKDKLMSPENLSDISLAVK